jgi:HK97 family phage prohead protease
MVYRSSEAFELRSSDNGPGIMVVNFARFNEWTEIRSPFEGAFMERFAAGAFAKTFKERAGRIGVLLEHGRDPQAGMKPLGSIVRLEERSDGAWGEVELLDADYVHAIVPGLRAGLYGASFAFRPVKVDENRRPERSASNPDGLPEVTVTEAMLREFGPVTFGQYENATAGMRSLTDQFGDHGPAPAAVDVARLRLELRGGRRVA